MRRHTPPTKVILARPVRRERSRTTRPSSGGRKPPPQQRGDEPKTVYLRRDGDGWWVITCSYHARFIELLKREVPTRRWCHEDKTWRVPDSQFPLLREVLDQCFERIVIVRPRAAAGDIAADPKISYVDDDKRTRVKGSFDYGRAVDDEEDLREVEPGELDGLEDKVKVQGEEK